MRAVLSEKVTQGYLFAMIVGYLLFTGTQGYNDLNATKFFFFAVCTAVWLLVLFIALCVQKRKVKMEQRDLLILLFLIACCVSTVLSDHASFFSVDTGRYDGLCTWLLYGAILMGVSNAGKACPRYLYAFAAAYGICCMVAVLQLMGKNPLWLYLGTWNYYSPFIQESGGFLGTLGNVDVLSALHCLAIPMFCSACITLNNKKSRILLFPVVLGIICVIGAGVASGVVALGATLYFYFPAWVNRALGDHVSKQRRKKIQIAIRTAITIMALLFLLTVYFIPFGSGTLYELHCVLHGVIQDHFGSHRIQIWRRAVQLITEHPVFGIGPDCAMDYFNICFSRYSEVFEETIYAYADHAHNEYLQILINFGIVGFLPLALLMGRTIMDVFRCRDNPAIQIMTPGFVCYLIQAFFNIGSNIVAPFFWISWGLILAAINQELHSAPQSDPPCHR